MLSQLKALWTVLRARWEALRQQPDGGYTTETVLVTALLVVAALAIIVIVIAKVTAKANGITM